MPAKKKITPKKKTDMRRSTARKPSARAKARPAKKAEAKGLRLTDASPSLTVNDLDASLAFYRDVLGFVIKDRWERDGKLMGVELGAGGVTFYVGQDDWK